MLLEWCTRHDRSFIQVSKVQSTNKLLSIASICAHQDEVGKFDVNLSGDLKWSYSLSTLVLSRGRISGQEVCPSEFHSQYGLVFQRGQVPRIRGFLWSQPHAYMTLLPLDMGPKLEEIAERYRNAERTFHTHGLARLHQAVVEALVGLNGRPGCGRYLATALEMNAALQDPTSEQMVVIDQAIEAYRRRFDIELTAGRHNALCA